MRAIDQHIYVPHDLAVELQASNFHHPQICLRPLSFAQSREEFRLNDRSGQCFPPRFPLPISECFHFGVSTVSGSAEMWWAWLGQLESGEG